MEVYACLNYQVIVNTGHGPVASLDYTFSFKSFLLPFLLSYVLHTGGVFVQDGCHTNA